MANELILIVEDNAKNMKLTRDVLGFHGYRVLEATTAEEGIALAQREQPDLILMDINLPGLDGTAALARLRADPATARIRVAALTAFAMKDDLARFRAAGFDGYLAKPISVRELPGQIRQLLAAANGTPDGAPDRAAERAAAEPEPR
jgi:two-component system cell cycle response regulator DivK